tara:strand:- start:634 stop:801 length:168 start_codon:yes stop_codon:yes gene_type:complete
MAHSVQSDIICSVCFSHPIKVALSCGHILCEMCAPKCLSCPECREPVTKRLKLFY